MPEQELSFGQRIKQQRRALDLTQVELAGRAGCSVDTIRKLEAGSLRPSRQLAEILAAQLEIPPGDQPAFVALARSAPVRAVASRRAATARTHVTPTAGWPVQPTSFIGRQRETAACLAILRRADARLLTLVGPGGVGKTRLALRITEELMDDFKDGVVFVQLAPILHADLVAQAIAAGLGLVEPTDRPLLDALTDFLREKQLLLALDNFEQVALAAPLLVELLIAAAGLKLLVTSREVLRLSGEHVFLVPPLSLPDLTALPAPDRLPEYEAVALFLQRAAAARPGFMLTTENATAIAAICSGLDGLPLAIELAAARIRLFSPAAMFARLQGRLAWLTGGPRDRTNHQQTLRATLDWSYNLLDPAQQAVLARLAVFAGGCTLEAADVVAGADFDAIAALVDKSLLQEKAGPDGAARFQMLETVREYGLERLVESGQDPAVRLQHARYFADLATQADAMLRSPERGAWLTRLDAEQENIRAALAWCLEGPGDQETGLRLAGALVWYWRRRYPAEGRWWLPLAAAATADGTLPELTGWCQAGAAFLMWLHADAEGARTGLAEAIDLLRRSGDRRKLAHALGWLGMVESDLGQYLPARAALDEALVIFAELGQEWDRAMGWQYSGIAEMQAWLTGGSRTLAVSHLEESYQIFVGLGDDWARAMTINPLALAIAEQGNYPAARSLLNEGLRLARQEGSPQATVEALQMLAWITRTHGDYAEAIPFLHEALALRRTLGDRRAEAGILHQLGFCIMVMGNLEQARLLCEEGLALSRQLGDRTGTGWALRDLATINRLAGAPAKALELYARALVISTGKDSPWFHLICLRDLVALLGPSRDPQTAATLLGAAQALEEGMIYFWFPDQSTNFESRLKTECVAAARAALEAEAFTHAWRAGYAMPPAHALDLALTAVRRRLGAEGLSPD